MCPHNSTVCLQFQQSCQTDDIMTRGWFDLFRDNGGPALYPESNRTSGLFIFLVATYLFSFF